MAVHHNSRAFFFFSISICCKGLIIHLGWPGFDHMSHRLIPAVKLTNISNIRFLRPVQTQIYRELKSQQCSSCVLIFLHTV